jgi:predicted RND superfamily exporter protein
LGIAESLAMDFFVGFSVDYVVHVAHQYECSPYLSRRLRVKSIYQNVGVAVFSGAATTLIAVTFLLFTKIYILHKFAIMIQLTLGFSILYALIIMPALLSTCGPQNHQGDLKVMIWDPIVKIFNCSRGKIKTKE